MKKVEIKSYDIEIELDGVINIIGLPASGKTYLLKKLINKVPNNDIFIDGKCIKNYDTKYLRENIMVILDSNHFNTKYVEEELLYYFEYLKIDKVTAYNELKRFSKYFGIEELLISPIKLLNTSEKAYIKILSFLILTPQILGIDNIMTLLDVNEKLKIIKFARDNNITILNVTTNKEELMLGSEILIIDNHQKLKMDSTLEMIKEEKLLNNNGMKVPFLVDLSNGLNYYDLLKNNFYNIDKLVGEIWK